MKSSNNISNFISNLRYDFPASIVVFLVAVPLCLGIALASGAPLFSGIIAGIVGGIVVGATSKSSLGVSGPAAGLAVIVLSSIETLGGFQYFLVAVVIGGLIQLALGFAKAGIIGYYFPSSVIKGMLSGIGLIIFLKQIPHAFGYDESYVGEFSFWQSDGENTFSELVNMINFITPGAVIISVVSILILLLWEQKFMKRIRLFQIVQGQLIVVIAGILLQKVFQGDPNFGLSKEHLVHIPVSGSFQGFLQQFSLPDTSILSNPQVYIVAITIAVVASLETLLSVEATDKLDPYKRVTPTNRELKAQGLGNVLSGMIGGLPITQVIVRSSTNVQSGGKTRSSAIIHGFLLLICAMSIPHILNMIPLASLACILFFVGYKLAKPSLFKQMYRLGWHQFIPFVVTILGIIFTDLLIGIGLGLVVAIMDILYRNYQTPYYFDPAKHNGDGTIEIKLSEHVSFINKASILHTLKSVPEKSKIVIDATNAKTIDNDVLELIDDFKENAKFNNIDLELINVNPREKVEPVKAFTNSVNKTNTDTKAAG